MSLSKKIAFIAAAMLILPVSVARGLDPVPDDFVERSIQVMVRDRVVTIQYAIGLTDLTLGQWLDMPVEQFGTDDDEQKKFEYYQTQAAKEVGERLQAFVDGRPVPINVDKIERSDRHHVRFIVMLSFTVGNHSQAALMIQDHNFEQFDGALRIALNARGTAMIQQSNVEALVVRADRHELGEMASPARQAASTIDARLTWLDLTK